MQSLKKERLSVRVTAAIKKMIITENLQPGDRLYSEKQLSEKLGVSRSSIREALRMLEVTGIIKVYQGKGVFINEPKHAEKPVKSWVVENADSLREHFEVRLLIEPHAAKIASERADGKDIKALQDLLQAFTEYVHLGDVPHAIATDSAFHLTVAKATNNRTLIVLMRTMEQTLNEGWYASLHVPGRLQASIEEHGALLHAIENGDAQGACKAMESHLQNALSDIQNYFGAL